MARRIGCSITLLLISGAASGQTSAWGDLPVPVRGPVTIWVVERNPDAKAQPGGRADYTIPKTVQESTVGDFAKIVSAPPANPVATGKGPGGFGVLSTTLPAATETNVETKTPVATTKPMIAMLSHMWLAFLDGMKQPFPELSVSAELVYDTDLEERLKHATDGTEPDLLFYSVGDWLSFRAPDVVASHCLRAIWPPDQFPQREEIEVPVRPRPGLLQPASCVLTSARNGAAARGIAVWLTEGGPLERRAAHTDAGSPEEVAREALRAALQGDDIGVLADTDIAGRRGVALSQRSRRPGTGKGDLPPVGWTDIYVEEEEVEIHGRLAVVTLFAAKASESDFGATHALVVLRLDAGGAWRALQISPLLSSSRQLDGLSLLASATGGKNSNPLASEGAIPRGISQAAPADGDTRIAPAELWWDNLGGASLQVVEWQTRMEQESWRSHLFYLPDNNARLKTQVTARFASVPGGYRWRVWSVGVDGTVVLSPWRGLTIVGR